MMVVVGYGEGSRTRNSNGHSDGGGSMAEVMQLETELTMVVVGSMVRWRCR